MEAYGTIRVNFNKNIPEEDNAYKVLMGLPPRERSSIIRKCFMERLSNDIPPDTSITVGNQPAELQGIITLVQSQHQELMQRIDMLEQLIQSMPAQTAPAEELVTEEKVTEENAIPDIPPDVAAFAEAFAAGNF